MAKMTTIGIQTPKLIVFGTFLLVLSLFQISDVKHEMLPVELKVCKNGIFWAKNLFQKNFPRLFLSPNQIYVKKTGPKGPLNGFYRGGALKAPPLNRSQFQRPLMVGLIL